MTTDDDVHHFKIDCAVWHPTVRSSLIVELVGLTPKIQWSAGDINEKTGAVRDRTYCRFVLGAYSQKQFDAGLSMLEPFEGLVLSRVFRELGGNMIIYFKNVSNAPELHINMIGLLKIIELKASLVFR